MQSLYLPHADSAIVSRDKILGYLSNPQHPDGAGKAGFFVSMGFRIEQWQMLTDALKRSVRLSPAVSLVASEHGEKYIVEGVIDTPSGKRPVVRTVWIVDKGESVPRLVTAYSCKEKA